ncbi:MAG: hypothetical protein ACXV8M_10415, partial [Candidatus Angelobacter sp.]
MATLNASHFRVAELLPSAARSRGAGEEHKTGNNNMELKDTNIAAFDQSDCTLAPGELVDQSGIYEICHQDEPRAS